MSQAKKTVQRGGAYYRVIAPSWVDPENTTYSRQNGGRWNPAGEFGALYLNATIQVAAANARSAHSGRAIKLFDLMPDFRPELVTFDVPFLDFLDVCSADGLAALDLHANFPFGVAWPACQAIGRDAHTNGLPGIAARSHAEVTATFCVGEELAVFEEVPLTPQARKPFPDWYPDPIPG